VNRRPHPKTALLALAVAAVLPLTGCADAAKAKPEERTFAFTGTALDVKAHGNPTDLIPADRTDVKVTRWFDTGAQLGSKQLSWTLEDGTLDLHAGCTGLADCEARFRVEVPRNVAVTRDGRATDLKG